MNHLTSAWLQWTSILSKTNCYPSIALDSLEHKANTNNVFSSCACSKWLPFPGDTSVVKIVQQEYFLTESPGWPIPQKSQLEETWEGCPTVHYPGMRPDCSTREGQAQKKKKKKWEVQLLANLQTWNFKTSQFLNEDASMHFLISFKSLTKVIYSTTRNTEDVQALSLAILHSSERFKIPFWQVIDTQWGTEGCFVDHRKDDIWQNASTLTVINWWWHWSSKRLAKYRLFCDQQSILQCLTVSQSYILVKVVSPAKTSSGKEVSSLKPRRLQKRKTLDTISWLGCLSRCEDIKNTSIRACKFCIKT